ncbi:Putative porin [Filimonas lacunae]|uniref:Putative porin n=1 Tax=Filimonas lacunae TaxID=477680 RepID=A0A173MLE2_9BACT|nr:putative porin [Filimonas lacunae]BAV08453.1 hypothetical protein FLA_4494 [Filimonas lacunae]SIT33959.1 Putative porin [Filimonas lacunae]
MSHLSRLVKFVCCVIAMLAVTQVVNGQISNYSSSDTSSISYDSQGRPIKKQKGNDSLQHRDPLEDSITISYRFYDSTRPRKIDSSLNDFTTRYPVPYDYVDLGNYGNATHSLTFLPNMQAGFDAGFHAYDIYQYKISDTRFFQTTRPYTELAYMLGSKSEQTIGVLHTQNRKPNFNFTFEYRFINSPGSYKSQNTSHNNIRFNTFYQSKNKRYTSYLIFITNTIKSGENGGVQNDTAVSSLSSQSLSDPFTVATRLANNVTASSKNFFSSDIGTSTQYNNVTFLYRHMYDLGQKDSIVTDSSVVRLFYPRIRFQHTLNYNSSHYQFKDNEPIQANYLEYFNLLVTSNPLTYKDSWKSLTNEFSIISFPEKNNLNQFLKLGAGYQTMKGEFLYYGGDTTFGTSFNNIYGDAEYRNRTRNQRWDIAAAARLYLTGAYSGDYSAQASIKGVLGAKIGSIQLGFQNVNRTPSYIYNNTSSFPSLSGINFKKENTTRLFANVEIPAIQLRLTGDFYLLNNYTYFDGFINANQDTSLFTLLHVSAQKMFKLSKYWHWYTTVHLQQKTGDAPVNVPLAYTTNRLVYEGNFFKNLFLATGMELRYYLPYKADSYSPLTGQFFYQNSWTTSNRPDINVFLHFRIKSFKGFLRLENINTFDPTQGFSFSKYNFAAQHYPQRGMVFRYGIWWNFVN